MRARTSLAAIAVSFAWVTGVAYAGGPGDVYNDFAQDGKLSCNHSHADLRAVLRSGSLNQYGDPLTLARLKLAVRRKLAGGCRAGSGSSRAGTGATGGRSTTNGRGASGGSANGSQKTNHAASGDQTGKRAKGGTGDRSSASLPSSAASAGVSNGGNGSFVSERVLVAALLVAGLAIGGWLTRRALAARH